MTTIAAIQGDGWVVMGADTQSTHDDYRKLYMTDDKVVNNNGILIAGCGGGRGMNLLHHAWKAPKPRANMTAEELDVWMVKTFIPSMRKLFVQNGYDMKDDGDYAKFDNVFIVAVQGYVYVIDEDYAFDRDIRKYVTSGSGGDFAQGAIYAYGPKALKNITDAKKAMQMAIDAAKEFDVNTGGETRIYIQKY